MAFATHRHPAFRSLQERRTLAALAASLMLGGCGQVLNPGATDLLSLNTPPHSQMRQAQANEPAQSGDELRKATEYWGDAYAKNPRDLKIALSYARNLKAMGEKGRAMAVLQQASIFHGESRELAGEYGRLALDLDQVNIAKQLLAGADDPGHPDWRIVSARGTVLAKEGKYGEAIPFYERALSLAHDQPSLLSNLALAYAMNGEPARAAAMLRQASSADTSPRIRQNLALVLGLQGKYDEAKLVAARDLSADKASDNAAYLRQVVKLDPKDVPNSEAGTEVAAWTTEQKAETAAAPVHAVQKLAQVPVDVAAVGDEGAVVDSPKWAAQTKAAAPSRAPARKVAEAKPNVPEVSKVADARPPAQWTSMTSTTTKKAEPAKPQPKTLSVAELAAALGPPEVAQPKVAPAPQPKKVSTSKPAAAVAAKAVAPGKTAAADDADALSWAPLVALQTSAKR